MKEITIWTRSTAMGYLLGKVVICIKANTWKMREKGMEKCIGLMGRFIKETGSKVFSTAMVN
jgi:hypothetical protein